MLHNGRVIALTVSELFRKKTLRKGGGVKLPPTQIRIKTVIFHEIISIHQQDLKFEDLPG